MIAALACWSKIGANGGNRVQPGRPDACRRRTGFHPEPTLNDCRTLRYIHAAYTAAGQPWIYPVDAALRYFNRTIRKNGSAGITDVRAFLQRRYPDVADAAVAEVRDRLARRYGR